MAPQLRHADRRAQRAAVRLTDVFAGSTETDNAPKWVQVTREGNFPGYYGGLRPFAFSRGDLETMVENARSHPAYEVDASGNPIGHVIPWDFNHASEMDPTSGELPVAGAPAQGWTLDLDVRNAPDGTAELWALTQFVEPARTYVKAGQYKWASVAVTFNSIDPESGQNVGAVVTSIALTNTPFVEGMESLVASRQVGQQQRLTKEKIETLPNGKKVTLRAYFYGPAKDVDEAIGNMKELFGLAETAGIAEVMAQITIVMGWFANGAAPLGTDPDFITASLRTILNLPTLTADVDVLNEAGKSIGLLLQSQAAAAGIAAPAAPTDTGMVPTIAAARQKDDKNMSAELLKTLATMMGVREVDAAVIDGARELVTLRAGLKELFGLDRDTNPIILGGAKDAATAKSKLMGLFTALGVDNPEAAVQKVAETMASAAQLKEVMPELEGLRADKAKTEEADAEADVDQAIAASKLPASVKPAFMLYRKQSRDKFREEYKLGAKAGSAGVTPEQKAALTKPNVANQPPTPRNDTGTNDVINLGAYKGPNPVARAKAYLASTVANWDKLDNDAQFLRAVNLRKQSNVIDQPVS